MRGLKTPTIKTRRGHWQVERVSGRVQVETRTGDRFRAQKDMIVRRGWKVKTGSGRTVFSRGAEKFVVSRGAIVTLEPKGILIKRMTVYQDRGQLDVDVTRRWYRHFRVETPFLAAVVKGTNFRSRVTQNTATISVGRGVVGVHDFASGQQANIGAGQSAFTNPARRVGLSVRGRTRPEVTQGRKRAPAFDTRIVRNVPATPAEARAANSSHSSNFGNTNGNGNANGNGNGNSNGNGNGRGR